MQFVILFAIYVSNFTRYQELRFESFVLSPFFVFVFVYQALGLCSCFVIFGLRE